MCHKESLSFHPYISFVWLYFQFSPYLFVWIWFLPISHVIWTKSCQCCFRCQMNSAGYVRIQGSNETCAKNAFAMYQSAPDPNGNSIFFLPELKKNWTDRQSNCKVTSRLNLAHGVWNPLGANVLCWPVNKFNEILHCVQSNTLTAWQSFELVSFHANLTGVQMDQNPYF